MTTFVILICIASIFVASVLHGAQAGIARNRREGNDDSFRGIPDVFGSFNQSIKDDINRLLQAAREKSGKFHPGSNDAATTAPKLDPSLVFDEIAESLKLNKTWLLKHSPEPTTSSPNPDLDEFINSFSSQVDDFLNSVNANLTARVNEVPESSDSDPNPNVKDILNSLNVNFTIGTNGLLETLDLFTNSNMTDLLNSPNLN